MRATDQSHGAAQSLNSHDHMVIKNAVSIKQDHVYSDGGACLTCHVGKEVDEDYGEQNQIYCNAASPPSSCHGPSQDNLLVPEIVFVMRAM